MPESSETKEKFRQYSIGGKNKKKTKVETDDKRDLTFGSFDIRLDPEFIKSKEKEAKDKAAIDKAIKDKAVKDNDAKDKATKSKPMSYSEKLASGKRDPNSEQKGTSGFTGDQRGSSNDHKDYSTRYRGSSNDHKDYSTSQRGSSNDYKDYSSSQRVYNSSQRGYSSSQRGNSDEQRGSGQRGYRGTQRGYSDGQRGYRGGQRGGFRGGTTGQRGSSTRGSGDYPRGSSSAQRGSKMKASNAASKSSKANLKPMLRDDDFYDDKCSATYGYSDFDSDDSDNEHSRCKPVVRPPPPEVKAAEERMDKAAHSKLYPDRKPRNEYVDIHMDLQHRIHQLLDTGDNDNQMESIPELRAAPAASINGDDCNPIALQTLQSYGFHISYCIEALLAQEGNVDLACRDLISQLVDDRIDYEKMNIDREEMATLRNDELISCGSVFQNNFKLMEKNRFYKLSLNLDEFLYFTNNLKNKGGTILDFTTSTNAKLHNELKEKERQSKLQLCRFFRGPKGCKFGTKCRMSHDDAVKDRERFVPEESEVLHKDKMFTLDFRFDNCYPAKPARISLYCTDDLLSGSARLAISKALNIQSLAYSTQKTCCLYQISQFFSDYNSIETCLKSIPPMNQPKIVDVSQVEDGMKSLEVTHKKKVEVKPTDRSHSVYQQRYDDKIVDDYARDKTSNQYKDHLKTRMVLPVHQRKNDIINIINDNQVVIICGTTGSGKTTQIPQYLLDDSIARYQTGGRLYNIACTQPRRISAITVSERVANERNCRIGKSIGYQIRLDNKTGPETRITYSSVGILLRRIEHSPLLDEYSHIIIDEVHERTEDIDFLMLLVKNIQYQRPELKLILMSASLDSGQFSKYYGDCPVINVEGKCFEVECYDLLQCIEGTRYKLSPNSRYKCGKYSVLQQMNKKHEVLENWDVEETAKDIELRKNCRIDQEFTVDEIQKDRYPESTKENLHTLVNLDINMINEDLISEIIIYILTAKHNFRKGGGILIFLPGIGEITSLNRHLQEDIDIMQRCVLVSLHSMMTSDEQKAVFKPCINKTKIVLATNIAETSITIPDIVFVIDSGRFKENRYDSELGIESLEIDWIAKQNAIQRQGRAGRVCKGACFKLYTNHFHLYAMRDRVTPEIRRVSLERSILRVKLIKNLGDKCVFTSLNELIEPPENIAIQDSLKKLKYLGALDSDQTLTPLGYHLAALPVDIRIGKLMLYGCIFRCLDTVLTISSSLSNKSVFQFPMNKKEEANAAKNRFTVPYSDHLTLVNAYEKWLIACSNGNREQRAFCRDNFVSNSSMEMISNVKRQFAELLSDIGFIDQKLSASQMKRNSRYGEDGILKFTGAEINKYSGNKQLVQALIVAALYPNIVKVQTPEVRYQEGASGNLPMPHDPKDFRFSSPIDHRICIHPSSVNFNKNYYPFTYLMYVSKVLTTRLFVQDCTLVSNYALILFSGGSINLSEIVANSNKYSISLDGDWLSMSVGSKKIGTLLLGLRSKIMELFNKRILDQTCTLTQENVIKVILELLSSE